jgi:uncharacterized caspase-like protein
MNRRTFLAGAAGALLMPLTSTGRAGERRLALVIGNGDYRFSPLKNPVNDARAMADALRAMGFTVEYHENAGKRAMIEAIRGFVLKSASFDVRLFYYAGHGVQMNGKNYLIPVDADVQAEDEIAARCADVGEILERLGRIKSGMNLVILDACRNNPFADGATAMVDGRRLRFRGATPTGLAPLDAPTGSLIAFSTAPGAVAIDGIDTTHSLYTKHLLQHISTPGLAVEQVFKRVRIAVTQESQRQQVPWESSSLMGDFCFRTLARGACR